MPAPGVPAIVAEPPPLSVNVTPAGRSPDVLVIVVAFVAVTAMEPATPTVSEPVAGLVNAGASGVAAGATVTLGLTVFYENLVRERQINTRLRNLLAAFAGLMMLAYLYLKLWDFLATSYYSHLPARANDSTLLESTTPYGVTFWWIEIILGALVPAIILLTPRLRRQDIWLVLAALLAMAGIIVNRWNVTLSGLVVPMDWSPGAAELFAVQKYTPTAPEWGVALGVLGYALLMLTLGLRYLPLFPKDDAHH